MSPRLHTVVLSDVHLSQAHPDDEVDPKWMRYRRRAYHPDREFAALIDLLLGACPDSDRDKIELCFNGDVFDFDARLQGCRPTPAERIKNQIAGLGVLLDELVGHLRREHSLV